MKSVKPELEKLVKRKNLIYAMLLACAGVALVLNGCRSVPDTECADNYDALTYDLLKEWCDGMIEHQVNNPSDPKTHGMLECPACEEKGIVHARCHDAVYPFMHMAHVTGEQKYLDAAINVMAWSKNVTGEDGRWTNDLHPKSWHGTTIFGAIALAEAIHYHGDILDEETLKEWKERLAFAAEGYLWKQFTKIDFTNVNYGLTATYGFNLIGHVLHEQKYIDRSREFAEGVKNYFTEPNKLLFGEGKPYNNLSGKGLLPVDLGYNVEESLNGAVLYALQENDTELLALLTESLNAHLQFMLPDGAWDNSWGTRQAKWTYWGSRTSDGCQPALSMLADRNPAFGTAAYKNTELLKRCTADGLLHGGPHYVSHGVKPCIHHTFTHAKALAFVQDNKHVMATVDTSAPLPRETANGVMRFDELDVSLAARGPWRATVSAYDSQYKTKNQKHIQQATGGALSVLYHEKIGSVLTSSMAEYVLVEPNNMQPQPGEDFALTPRIETRKDGVWYTNLFDLKAAVDVRDDGKVIRYDVQASLCDRDHAKMTGVADYRISYILDEQQVQIDVAPVDGTSDETVTSLVLPLISQSGETARMVGDNRIEIEKPGGTLVLESTAALTIRPAEKDRIFNMVPGMECIPVVIELPKERGTKAICTISLQ